MPQTKSMYKINCISVLGNKCLEKVIKYALQQYTKYKVPRKNSQRNRKDLYGEDDKTKILEKT